MFPVWHRAKAALLMVDDLCRMLGPQGYRHLVMRVDRDLVGVIRLPG